MNLHFKNNTDQELLNRLKSLGQQGARLEVQIILHLQEVQERRLHLRQGHASLFEFIVAHLKCSEATAYRRGAVLRAARKLPLLLQFIEDQKLTLTGAGLLAKHLTNENYVELLNKAAGLPTRGIENLIATLKTAPEKKPDVIKPIGRQTGPEQGDQPTTETTKEPESSASHLDMGNPLVLGSEMETPTAQRVRITFEASERLVKKIERLKEILGTSIPSNSLEDIVDLAFEALLEKRDPERKLARKEKRAETKAELANSDKPADVALPTPEKIERRTVPQSIKDAVWRRDGGRCCYVGPEGRRCASRKSLEFDHVLPWAMGGRSDDADNVRLLCKNHNLFMAGRHFPQTIAKMTSALQRTR